MRKDPELNRVRAEKRKKHGHTRAGGFESRTYRSWHTMLQRCRSEDGPRSDIYYGLEVDPRWDTKVGGSFKNFLEDMGERPEGHTLDRKDGKLGYTASNCRWADLLTQNRNKESVYDQEYVEQIVAQWMERKGSISQKAFCREVGITSGSLHYWMTVRAPHIVQQAKSSTPDSSMTIAVHQEA